MSYAQFGTVEASDYNLLVGGNPTTTANRLNTVLSTGGTNSGYGQTALANVNIGDTINATAWANIVNRTSNIASHQGSSITPVTAPSSGNTVSYIAALSTNLTTIYNNRANAAIQGTTSANGSAISTAWATAITFTYTAAWANGDAARYFFNSGGQIKFTFTQPTGTTMADSYNALATACGTLVISGGTATIAGNSFTPFTKVGGSGSPTQYITSNGYYQFSTGNTTLFSQATGSPVGYEDSFINLITKTNGTQGINGDNGNVLTFYSVWQQAPGTGSTVTSGGNVVMTIVYPETTYISNSWGAVTTTCVVSGT